MKKVFSNSLSIVLWVGLLCVQISAQTNILAALDFEIPKDGFGFKNYKNEGDKWKDDIGAEDLIRMFGVEAVCKSGDSAKNCVMEATARTWIEHYLKAMDIGHCEGIGVASLRMHSGLAFKKRTAPGEFQNGIELPFKLRREQSIENYVAYYWITQTFDEVSEPTAKTAALGPVGIVRMLVEAMNNQTDTYLIGIKKYQNGRIFDGHALVPIAVEDAGIQYKIHVYDNNFPGERRYLYINKGGTQQWTYNGTNKPGAAPNYVGDLSTRTLDITATSWREGRCFKATFAKKKQRATGCGMETSMTRRTAFDFTKASFAKRSQDADVVDAEFFLTGEGDMLVVEDGRRLGFDPRDENYYREIAGANPNLLVGGFEEDLQHYTMPYRESAEPYTIIFSGRNLEQESTLDFVLSAPGFTVGFDGIRLDPDETLTATISHDGEQISFTASADGETPEVFFAFDSDEEDAASYITMIEGVELSAETTLTYDFDFENGKLFFSDDDGNEDAFDIELLRINADGTVQTYVQNDLDIGTADKYEMDFADWDGEGEMCFKDDEDGDGFSDEQCSEQSNEEPDDSSEGR